MLYLVSSLHSLISRCTYTKHFICYIFSPADTLSSHIILIPNTSFVISSLQLTLSHLTLYLPNTSFVISSLQLTLSHFTLYLYQTLHLLYLLSSWHSHLTLYLYQTLHLLYLLSSWHSLISRCTYTKHFICYIFSPADTLSSHVVLIPNTSFVISSLQLTLSHLTLYLHQTLHLLYLLSSWHSHLTLYLQTLHLLYLLSSWHFSSHLKNTSFVISSLQLTLSHLTLYLYQTLHLLYLLSSWHSLISRCTYQTLHLLHLLSSWHSLISRCTYTKHFSCYIFSPADTLSSHVVLIPNTSFVISSLQLTLSHLTLYLYQTLHLLHLLSSWHSLISRCTYTKHFICYIFSPADTLSFHVVLIPNTSFVTSSLQLTLSHLTLYLYQTLHLLHLLSSWHSLISRCTYTKHFICYIFSPADTLSSHVVLIPNTSFVTSSLQLTLSHLTLYLYQTLHLLYLLSSWHSLISTLLTLSHFTLYLYQTLHLLHLLSSWHSLISRCTYTKHFICYIFSPADTLSSHVVLIPNTSFVTSSLQLTLSHLTLYLYQTLHLLHLLSSWHLTLFLYKHFICVFSPADTLSYLYIPNTSFVISSLQLTLSHLTLYLYQTLHLLHLLSSWHSLISRCTYIKHFICYIFSPADTLSSHVVLIPNTSFVISSLQLTLSHLTLYLHQTLHLLHLLSSWHSLISRCTYTKHFICYIFSPADTLSSHVVLTSNTSFVISSLQLTFSHLTLYLYQTLHLLYLLSSWHSISRCTYTNTSFVISSLQLTLSHLTLYLYQTLHLLYLLSSWHSLIHVVLISSFVISSLQLTLSHLTLYLYQTLHLLYLLSSWHSLISRCTYTKHFICYIFSPADTLSSHVVLISNTSFVISSLQLTLSHLTLYLYQTLHLLHLLSSWHSLISRCTYTKHFICYIFSPADTLSSHVVLTSNTSFVISSLQLTLSHLTLYLHQTLHLLYLLSSWHSLISRCTYTKHFICYIFSPADTLSSHVVLIPNTSFVISSLQLTLSHLTLYLHQTLHLLYLLSSWHSLISRCTYTKHFICYIFSPADTLSSHVVLTPNTSFVISSLQLTLSHLTLYLHQTLHLLYLLSSWHSLISRCTYTKHFICYIFSPADTLSSHVVLISNTSFVISSLQLTLSHLTLYLYQTLHLLYLLSSWHSLISRCTYTKHFICYIFSPADTLSSHVVLIPNTSFVISSLQLTLSHLTLYLYQTLHLLHLLSSWHSLISRCTYTKHFICYIFSPADTLSSHVVLISNTSFVISSLQLTLSHLTLYLYQTLQLLYLLSSWHSLISRCTYIKHFICYIFSPADTLSSHVVLTPNISFVISSLQLTLSHLTYIKHFICYIFSPADTLSSHVVLISNTSFVISSLQLTLSSHVVLIPNTSFVISSLQLTLSHLTLYLHQTLHLLYLLSSWHSLISRCTYIKHFICYIFSPADTLSSHVVLIPNTSFVISSLQLTLSHLTLYLHQTLHLLYLLSSWHSLISRCTYIFSPNTSFVISSLQLTLSHLTLYLYQTLHLLYLLSSWHSLISRCTYTKHFICYIFSPADTLSSHVVLTSNTSFVISSLQLTLSHLTLYLYQTLHLLYLLSSWHSLISRCTYTKHFICYIFSPADTLSSHVVLIPNTSFVISSLQLTLSHLTLYLYQTLHLLHLLSSWHSLISRCTYTKHFICYIFSPADTLSSHVVLIPNTSFVISSLQLTLSHLTLYLYQTLHLLYLLSSWHSLISRCTYIKHFICYIFSPADTLSSHVVLTPNISFVISSLQLTLSHLTLYLHQTLHLLYLLSSWHSLISRCTYIKHFICYIFSPADTLISRCTYTKHFICYIFSPADTLSSHVVLTPNTSFVISSLQLTLSHLTLYTLYLYVVQTLHLLYLLSSWHSLISRCTYTKHFICYIFSPADILSSHVVLISNTSFVISSLQLTLSSHVVLISNTSFVTSSLQLTLSHLTLYLYQTLHLLYLLSSWHSLISRCTYTKHFICYIFSPADTLSSHVVLIPNTSFVISSLQLTLSHLTLYLYQTLHLLYLLSSWHSLISRCTYTKHFICYIFSPADTLSSHVVLIPNTSFVISSLQLTLSHLTLYLHQTLHLLYLLSSWHSLISRCTYTKHFICYIFSPADTLSSHVVLTSNTSFVISSLQLTLSHLTLYLHQTLHLLYLLSSWHSLISRCTYIKHFICYIFSPADTLSSHVVLISNTSFVISSLQLTLSHLTLYLYQTLHLLYLLSSWHSLISRCTYTKHFICYIFSPADTLSSHVVLIPNTSFVTSSLQLTLSHLTLYLYQTLHLLYLLSSWHSLISRCTYTKHFICYIFSPADTLSSHVVLIPNTSFVISSLQLTLSHLTLYLYQTLHLLYLLSSWHSLISRCTYTKHFICYIFSPADTLSSHVVLIPNTSFVTSSLQLTLSHLTLYLHQTLHLLYLLSSWHSLISRCTYTKHFICYIFSPADTLSSHVVLIPNTSFVISSLQLTLSHLTLYLHQTLHLLHLLSSWHSLISRCTYTKHFICYIFSPADTLSSHVVLIPNTSFVISSLQLTLFSPADTLSSHVVLIPNTSFVISSLQLTLSHLTLYLYQTLHLLYLLSSWHSLISRCTYTKHFSCYIFSPADTLSSHVVLIPNTSFVISSLQLTLSHLTLYLYQTLHLLYLLSSWHSLISRCTYTKHFICYIFSPADTLSSHVVLIPNTSFVISSLQLTLSHLTLYLYQTLHLLHLLSSWHSLISRCTYIKHFICYIFSPADTLSSHVVLISNTSFVISSLQLTLSHLTLYLYQTLHLLYLLSSWHSLISRCTYIKHFICYIFSPADTLSSHVVLIPNTSFVISSLQLTLSHLTLYLHQTLHLLYLLSSWHSLISRCTYTKHFICYIFSPADTLSSHVVLIPNTSFVISSLQLTLSHLTLYLYQTLHLLHLLSSWHSLISRCTYTKHFICYIFSPADTLSSHVVLIPNTSFVISSLQLTLSHLTLYLYQTLHLLHLLSSWHSLISRCTYTKHFICYIFSPADTLSSHVVLIPNTSFVISSLQLTLSHLTLYLYQTLHLLYLLSSWHSLISRCTYTKHFICYIFSPADTLSSHVVLTPNTSFVTSSLQLTLSHLTLFLYQTLHLCLLSSWHSLISRCTYTKHFICYIFSPADTLSSHVVLIPNTSFVTSSLQLTLSHLTLYLYQTLHLLYLLSSWHSLISRCTYTKHFSCYIFSPADTLSSHVVLTPNTSFITSSLQLTLSHLTLYLYQTLHLLHLLSSWHSLISRCTYTKHFICYIFSPADTLSSHVVLIPNTSFVISSLQLTLSHLTLYLYQTLHLLHLVSSWHSLISRCTYIKHFICYIFSPADTLSSHVVLIPNTSFVISSLQLTLSHLTLYLYQTLHLLHLLSSWHSLISRCTYTKHFICYIFSPADTLSSHVVLIPNTSFVISSLQLTLSHLTLFLYQTLHLCLLSSWHSLISRCTYTKHFICYIFSPADTLSSHVVLIPNTSFVTSSLQLTLSHLTLYLYQTLHLLYLLSSWHSLISRCTYTKHFICYIFSPADALSSHVVLIPNTSFVSSLQLTSHVVLIPNTSFVISSLQLTLSHLTLYLYQTLHLLHLLSSWHSLISRCTYTKHFICYIFSPADALSSHVVLIPNTSFVSSLQLTLSHLTLYLYQTLHLLYLLSSWHSLISRCTYTKHFICYIFSPADALSSHVVLIPNTSFVISSLQLTLSHLTLYLYQTLHLLHLLSSWHSLISRCTYTKHFICYIFSPADTLSSHVVLIPNTSFVTSSLQLTLSHLTLYLYQTLHLLYLLSSWHSLISRCTYTKHFICYIFSPADTLSSHVVLIPNTSFVISSLQLTLSHLTLYLYQTLHLLYLLSSWHSLISRCTYIKHFICYIFSPADTLSSHVVLIPNTSFVISSLQLTLSHLTLYLYQTLQLLYLLSSWHSLISHCTYTKHFICYIFSPADTLSSHIVLIPNTSFVISSLQLTLSHLTLYLYQTLHLLYLLSSWHSLISRCTYIKHFICYIFSPADTLSSHIVLIPNTSVVISSLQLTLSHLTLYLYQTLHLLYLLSSWHSLISHCTYIKHFICYIFSPADILSSHVVLTPNTSFVISSLQLTLSHLTLYLYQTLHLLYLLSSWHSLISRCTYTKHFICYIFSPADTLSSHVVLIPNTSFVISSLQLTLSHLTLYLYQTLHLLHLLSSWHSLISRCTYTKHFICYIFSPADTLSSHVVLISNTSFVISSLQLTLSHLTLYLYQTLHLLYLLSSWHSLISRCTYTKHFILYLLSSWHSSSHSTYTKHFICYIFSPADTLSSHVVLIPNTSFVISSLQLTLSHLTLYLYKHFICYIFSPAHSLISRCTYIKHFSCYIFSPADTLSSHFVLILHLLYLLSSWHSLISRCTYTKHFICYIFSPADTLSSHVVLIPNTSFVISSLQLTLSHLTLYLTKHFICYIFSPADTLSSHVVLIPNTSFVISSLQLTLSHLTLYLYQTLHLLHLLSSWLLSSWHSLISRCTYTKHFICYIFSPADTLSSHVVLIPNTSFVTSSLQLTLSHLTLYLHQTLHLLHLLSSWHSLISRCTYTKHFICYIFSPADTLSSHVVLIPNTSFVTSSLQLTLSHLTLYLYQTLHLLHLLSSWHSLISRCTYLTKHFICYIFSPADTLSSHVVLTPNTSFVTSSLQLTLSHLTFLLPLSSVHLL